MAQKAPQAFLAKSVRKALAVSLVLLDRPDQRAPLEPMARMVLPDSAGKQVQPVLLAPLVRQVPPDQPWSSKTALVRLLVT